MKEQDINDLVRKNILKLSPYSSARDEYQGREGIFLDANENPYETGFNRYPDPRQLILKERIGQLKNVDVKNIFLGNGSDEAIDLLVRAFCEPGKDNILIPQPTYGMYEVCAAIQDIEMRKPFLNADYSLNVEAILSLADAHSKLLFLCSPNNPTGNCLDVNDIKKLLVSFNGLVIVDEAYIDFAPGKSMLPQLAMYPNLVVLQTLSKAWGMAGIRLGMAFANELVINILSKVKAPYNVNILTQQAALEKLNHIEQTQNWIATIIEQREWLTAELKKLPLVLKVYPSDANFLLVKVDDPGKLYQFLVGKSIVVRDRSRVALCEGCLRISVGKPEENEALVKTLSTFTA